MSSVSSPPTSEVNPSWFSGFGLGAWAVWMRNFLVLRKTLATSLLWVFGEPILYFLAIGYGLGQYIVGIQGQAYVTFLLPGLMVASSMMTSFFETTYGTFTKLHQQKSLQSLLLTPILSSEIALGEISWGATKGLLSAFGILAIALLQQIIPFELGIQVLGICAITSWLFAAFGIWMTGVVMSYDGFALSQSCFIVPMYLLSGTFFPLENAPPILQNISFLFPLTHAVTAARQITSESFHTNIAIHIGALILVALLLTVLGIRQFQKKLIG